MQLLSTIVTSALVATVSGAAITEWLRSRDAKQTARFDALSAAVTLEGYGIWCAEEIANHNLAVDSGGHAGSSLSTVPELTALPKLSVVAEFLRPGKGALIDRMLTLPQDARQADQFVSFWWDVTAGSEETQEAAVMQTARIGAKAVALAKDLRREFSLPDRELVFGKFDVQNILEEKVGNKST